MAETIVELLTDVADAIREKKGSNEPINAQNFANEIKNLPSGGGEVVEVERKDVNFYDYEGTLLFSYTLAEAQALTELPTPKGHEGLEFQGWNYTLEELKTMLTEVGSCDIGAHYITDDGNTRLYITISTLMRAKVSVNLINQKSGGSVTIQWGDGSEDTYSSSNIVAEHNYEAIGDYIITITPSDNTTILLGQYSSSVGIIHTVSNYDYGESSKLRKVEIGRNAILSNAVFANCVLLEAVSIPLDITLTNSVFMECRSLRFLTMPRSEHNLPSCFSNSGIRAISIPCTNTAITANMLSGCINLLELFIPHSVTQLGASCNSSSKSLVKVVLPKTILTIPANTFADNGGVLLYDFSHHEEVPTIDNISAFRNISANCRIVVPDELFDDWKGQTNWSTYADRIVKASEYGN